MSLMMRILSTITVYASLQFAVLGDVEAHEANCTSEKGESIDREAFGVTLLQSHMRLQSASPSSRKMGEQALDAAYTSHRSRGSHGSLLILVVTCRQNAWKWWPVHEWAKKVHPNGTALLLVGLPPGTVMNKPYELNMTNSTLMVNTSDTYDALAVKVVAGYKAIFKDPMLSFVNYVYKIDDTSIPHGSLPGDLSDYNITGFNATEVEEALASQPGDYLSSEFGYTAMDCERIKEHKPELMEWHFHRIQAPNYWYQRRQPCEWTFAYANGAFGYFLSRHALELISKHWPSEESMVDLYHQFIYEDIAVGVTLASEGVKATPVHLKGHTPWNIRVCPCSPPHPEAACDSYCSTHTTSRCCHATCREHPGLCTDVVYA